MVRLTDAQLFECPLVVASDVGTQRRSFSPRAASAAISRSRSVSPGDAPIRHADHIVRATDGGETSADNGQGLCERCNYVKESPGWTSWVADPGDACRHEVHGVTEHLRILRSTSPPAPGGDAGSVDYSPLELQLASNFTLAS
mgnify:CR=1 FL=1